MNKNIKNKILVFILMTFFIVPKSVAHAEVLDFPTINMELNIPEHTIILSKDTPLTDEIWNVAGINDPASELESMKKQDVQSILFDPITRTRVNILSKQSKQSNNIFHLTALTEEELNGFLSNIIQVQDETIRYNAHKYPQKETTFYRLFLETTQNNLHHKELVYGTIVNGLSVSFHIYEDNKEESINEEYLKSIVDGVHFTKYLDIEEAKKQAQLFTIYRIASIMIILLIFAIWLFVLKKKKQKKNNQKKRKTEELSKFYLRMNEMGDTNKTILFRNCSIYTKQVFQTFFLYHEVIGKKNQLIRLSIFYIIAFILLTIAKASFATYIMIIFLIFTIIFLKKIAIEKLVNREIKLFNITKSKEVKFQFYDDYLTMNRAQVNITYPYLQITKIVAYKNYIYLYIDANKALYLCTDGFDQNADDFIRFIKQKTAINI